MQRFEKCFPSKFILIALPIAGILSVLLVVMVLKNFQKQLDAVMRDKTESIAKILIERLKAPVDFDDTDAMIEVAESISNDLDFGYIYIYRTSGKEISHFRHPTLQKVPDKKRGVEKPHYFVAAKMANIATPIIVERNKDTVMQIGITYARIQNGMFMGTTVAFISGMLVCCFLTLLGVGVIKRRARE